MTVTTALATALLVSGVLAPVASLLGRGRRPALAMTLELWTAAALVLLSADRSWGVILLAAVLVLLRAGLSPRVRSLSSRKARARALDSFHPHAP